MRELWIAIGLIAMILGVIGIVLPVLPTTPFFLLTTYSFTKGSTKFHRWFTGLPMVSKYGASMTMTKKKKWILLLTVDTILIGYILYFQTPLLTIVLLAIILIKHIVFHRYVTIQEPNQKA